jgi:hypothetical protein
MLFARHRSRVIVLFRARRRVSFAIVARAIRTRCRAPFPCVVCLAVRYSRMSHISHVSITGVTRRLRVIINCFRL